MTPAQFTRAVSATRIRSESIIAAARLVLVDKLGPGEAAERTGTDQGNVSRAVAKIQPRTPCTRCQGSGREPAEHEQ